MHNHYATYLSKDGQHKIVLQYDEMYSIDKSCGRSITEPCELQYHHGYTLAGGIEVSPEQEAAECQKFAEQEYQNLESGEWVALVVIQYEKCRGMGAVVDAGHCGSCSGWNKDDDGTYGGMVVESYPTIKALEAVDLPAGYKVSDFEEVKK